MSIVQGGPGLPIFHPSIYHYVATDEYLGQLKDDNEVPDPETRSLLDQVCEYT